LAALYPDDVIAGILNRQGRKTATGERFTANQVGGLRCYHDIPRFHPPAEPPAGQLVPIRQAAQILGIYPSTVHRWLNDGFLAGEQVTPSAPWQIRLTEELRARFVEQAPARISADAGSRSEIGRIPSNGAAENKARRARSLVSHPWTPPRAYASKW
jgi:hypothetical protein